MFRSEMFKVMQLSRNVINGSFRYFSQSKNPNKMTRKNMFYEDSWSHLRKSPLRISSGQRNIMSANQFDQDNLYLKGYAIISTGVNFSLVYMNWEEIKNLVMNRRTSIHEGLDQANQLQIRKDETEIMLQRVLERIKDLKVETVASVNQSHDSNKAEKSNPCMSGNKEELTNPEPLGEIKDVKVETVASVHSSHDSNKAEKSNPCMSGNKEEFTNPETLGEIKDVKVETVASVSSSHDSNEAEKSNPCISGNKEELTNPETLGGIKDVKVETVASVRTSHDSNKVEIPKSLSEPENKDNITNHDPFGEMKDVKMETVASVDCSRDSNKVGKSKLLSEPENKEDITNPDRMLSKLENKVDVANPDQTKSISERENNADIVNTVQVPVLKEAENKVNLINPEELHKKGTPTGNKDFLSLILEQTKDDVQSGEKVECNSQKAVQHQSVTDNDHNMSPKVKLVKLSAQNDGEKNIAEDDNVQGAVRNNLERQDNSSKTNPEMSKEISKAKSPLEDFSKLRGLPIGEQKTENLLEKPKREKESKTCEDKILITQNPKQKCQQTKTEKEKRRRRSKNMSDSHENDSISEEPEKIVEREQMIKEKLKQNNMDNSSDKEISTKRISRKKITKPKSTDKIDIQSGKINKDSFENKQDSEDLLKVDKKVDSSGDLNKKAEGYIKEKPNTKPLFYTSLTSRKQKSSSVLVRKPLVSSRNKNYRDKYKSNALRSISGKYKLPSPLATDYIRGYKKKF